MAWTADSAAAGLPARYRLIRPLGEGAQKRVHLAEDTLLDRQVAISSIALDHAAAGADALAEARAMARVGERPHVVSIHDVIETSDAVHIVSPYLPGGSLAERLRREPGGLAIAELLRFGAQLCSGLASAHAVGIAHRDLKPANALLDAAGDVHLADFGLAALWEAGSGGVVGTPEYMAPELWTGADGERGDLYALGCTLYELATGKPPFVGVSTDDVLRLHQLAAPEPPSRHRRGLPVLLDELILSLLEKDPARRSASPEDVRAALEGLRRAGAGAGPVRRAPAEPAHSGSHRAGVARDVPLVGRASELARIETALERAQHGGRGVILVRGEAGSGKSRLLRELRERAEARGIGVLQGAAHEDEPLPYRPFVDAMLPLATRLGELAGPDAERVRAFLQLDSASAAAVSVAGRYQLFAALIRGLFRFARDRPLVFALDDLHWADAASLDLLEQLACAVLEARESDAGLWIVGGLRPVDDGGRLARVLERLELDPACEILSLEGLDLAGVERLLRGLGVPKPASGLVRAVRDTTGGNPLFVRELVAHLERHDGLRLIAGSSVGAEGSELRLPASLTQAIAERIEMLAPATRRLLTQAAVLGARFELQSLAAVAELSFEVVLAHLDEALALELVVDEGQAARFSHPLVRQVFVERAGPTRVQRMHLAVARRLEREPSSARGDAPIEIAHHLIRAGPLAPPEDVVHHAGLAAERALAKYAWDEAAGLAEEGLAAGGPGLAVAERARLHRLAAEAYLNSADTDLCLHHGRQAIECHRAAGDPVGLARALGDHLHATGHFGKMPLGELPDVAPLEEALEHLDPAERALRARLLGILAQTYWFGRNYERAVSLASASLALAESVGDDARCAQSSVHLAVAHLQRIDFERAEAAFQTGMARSRRAGDLFGLQQCVVRRAVLLIAQGRLEQAEQALGEASELDRAVHNLRDATLAQAFRLALAVARGDFDAVDELAAAMDWSARVKHVNAGHSALPNLAYACAMRGDARGAHAAIDLLVRPGVVEDEPRLTRASEPLNRALIDAYLGEPVDPERVPRFDGFDLERLDLPLVMPICAAFELAEAAGLRAPDPSAREALERASRLGLVFGPGWPFFVPRLCSLAALRAGDLDLAASGFEEAAERARRIGATPEIARCHGDLARTLVERDAPGDRVRAAALLTRALPALRALGPPGAVHRAEKLAALVGAPAAAPSASHASKERAWPEPPPT